MLLVPLPTAVPLLVAAFLAGTGKWIHWRAASLLAIATSAFTCAVCVALVLSARLQTVVYWFGQWLPRDGIALGISFVIDPMAAGMAVLASSLVTAALIFSWRYFDTVGNFYHVLMLVFLAAMCGFSLTGDLFNMFVFFELMSASAFALCGYRSEAPATLQGALNFAVTNTIGGFLVLSGTALLYGRTGALNLAQIGRTLDQAPDGLILIAFVFILCGFFVKAAVVPFHFWLNDAHAVAPTPVCILFSGVMVELGLYGIIRVYWTVFEGPLGPQAPVLRNILIGMGALTSLLGGLMCFVQRHLKRLLAFSTVSHMGLLVIGLGLLTPGALAGVALYVIGHAMVKAALFLCVGILLHRFGSVDELELRGRGRNLPLTGAVFAFAGLGLTGAPLFSTFLGTKWVEEAAVELGYGWLKVFALATAVLTGAAVLRAAGRVFLGWGSRKDEQLMESPQIREERETIRGHRRVPAVMMLPPIVLSLMSVGISLVPGLPYGVDSAAIQMQQRSAYAIRVLYGISTPAPIPNSREAIFAGLLSGFVPSVVALLLALFALFREQLPFQFSVGSVLTETMHMVRRLHSGRVGDYVMWLTMGVAALGLILTLSLG